MSYSFSVLATDKTLAKITVAAKFDEVVTPHQPIHKRDRDAALAVASAMIDLLVDDDAMDVSVSLNGYVSWRDNLKDDASNPLVAASVGCSAALITRQS